uniref:DDE Tnp4 domain-containing protein n=1 Tax=Ditylenchus dipsaci TaxID=166011 RepID=A0A915E9C4_9BILA
MASGSSSTRITRAQTNRTDRFVDSTPTLGPKSIDALSKLTDLEERLQQTTSQTQNELHQQRLAYVKQQLQETREDSALLNAIAWWFLRKRRSYVRPAHYQAAFQRNSFETFWRYYRSPDERDLVRFLRLSRAEFDEVHSKVNSLSIGTLPDSSSTDTGHGKACHFSQIHCVGPTYCAVAHLFAIGDSTVYDICKEVSQAIVTVMQAEFMPPPNRQTWERSAEGFARLREFPKTLGAVDGKHIAIVKPEHSGAAFFNYKVIPRSYTPCPIFHSCMFENFIRLSYSPSQMRNLVLSQWMLGPQEEIATLLYGSQARLGHFSNHQKPISRRVKRARNRSTLHDCSRNSAQLLKPSSMMTMEYIFAFRMIDDYLLIKERQKPEELEEELGNNLLML